MFDHLHVLFWNGYHRGMWSRRRIDGFDSIRAIGVDQHTHCDVELDCQYFSGSDWILYLSAPNQQSDIRFAEPFANDITDVC
jgi:hypothetical protein